MKKETREWINTLIAAGVLIVMIVGLFQLFSISIDLKEIGSEKIKTSQIEIVNESGDAVACIYHNGSYFLISSSEGGCP